MSVRKIMVNRLLCVAGLVLLTSCLDASPEDPRGFQGYDQGSIEPDLGGDTGVAVECPSRASDSPPSEDQCVHTFVYRHSGPDLPSSVKLAGDFECPAWQGAYAMVGPNEAGEWYVDINLRPGRYTYKFIVDDAWIPDPENPSRAPNSFGEEDSVVVHSCPFSPACILNGDCVDADRPVCRDYQCSPCTCPGSLSCHPTTGQCQDSPCAENADCSGGQVCSQGTCRACVANTECDAGEVCLEDACVEPQCVDDAGCDVLTESCTDYACGPLSCSTQVFVFETGGQQYARVDLAGQFTDWADGALPMTRLEDGRWLARVQLENGDWPYKFMAYRTDDGAPTWLTDPSAVLSAPDGAGGSNSVRRVECETDVEGFGRCGDPEVFDWRDAIMYFVMVDRFYDSDGQSHPVDGASGGDAVRGPSGQYEGGDLQGVTAKLDYLRELGVTSLWLSAPYENRDTAGAAIDPRTDPNNYSGYHGYWPSPADIDYSDPDSPTPTPAVESRIGSADDLHELVGQAHDKDMKVLFDYVMNHVDVESGLYQAHPEWFARRDGRFALCGPENLWNDPFWGTRCAFTDYLPPFDFDNAEARAWSVADAIWWAREFNIDGYRLDAIKHVADDWLTDLRDALDAAFPEPDGGRFYLVGETFDYENIELLRRYVDPVEKLDGQFDFPMKARLCEGVFQGRMSAFQEWMDNTNRGAYGPDAIMTTWIGNHDIPRAIHFASGEIGNCREGSSPTGDHLGAGWGGVPSQPQGDRAYELLGVAFGVLLTNPGIPLIYYGDEIGLAGGGDPDNRRMMPWNNDELSSAQRALRDRISAFARIRTTHRALSRGRRTTLASDGNRWVFRMACNNAAHADVSVAVNRGDQETDVPGLPAGQYVNVETGEQVDAAEVRIPARDILILRSAP